MTDRTVTDPAIAALIGRIQAGETLEEITRARIAPEDESYLKRVAVPRLFDRHLYDAILRPTGGPSFDSVRNDTRIERLSGYHVRLSVRPDLQPQLRALWWPDGRLPARPEAPPPELAKLLRRLVDYYAEVNDPLERLYHLSLIDERGAVLLLRELYQAADEQFDLAGCQNAIAAVGLNERPSLIGADLRAETNELSRALRVRGAFATDYYRTARFFVPEGLMDQISGFIQGTPSRVVQVVAEGGMGKTMRIRWFIARKCIAEGIPVARIDFDDVDPVVVGTDPWLVLLEFALQLHDQLRGTPFERLAADYGEYRPLLGRGSRVDGSGKGAVDLQAIRERAEADVLERFHAGLGEGAGDRPVVLILDTTEELVLPVRRNVTKLWTLLHALLEDHPGVRLILAGRHDLVPRSEGFATTFPEAIVHQIKPFSDAQAESYLRGRGIDDKELRHEIVRQSGGRPFKLALFGDIVQQEPDLTAERVAAYKGPDLLFLVERVLDRIPDEDVRWLLRYGVIPRWLTLEVARDVLAPFLARAKAGDPAFDDPREDSMPSNRRLGEDNFPIGMAPDQQPSIENVWAMLREYSAAASWVSMDGEALRFQPEVVEPMREVLQNRPAWAILQGAVAEWFERHAVDDPERWGESTAEAAYHRFQRDGEAAVPWWQAQLDRAWDVGRTDWLRRIAEVAPRTDESDGTIEAEPDASLRPASTVLAEFEFAAIDITELWRRDAPPSEQGWSAAGERLDRAVALDDGRGIIPASRHSLLQATLAYGQGQIAAALDEIEVGRSLQENVVDRAAFATLNAAVLASSGDEGSKQATDEALQRLGELVESDETALHDSVALSIQTLASIDLRNDRIAAAIAVYDQGLGLLVEQPGRRIDLGLLAADVEARWCQPGASLARIESVDRDIDRGAAATPVQRLRRDTTRARAELAAGRPTRAIPIVNRVLEELDHATVGSAESNEWQQLDASAREIRGQAKADLLQQDALDDLDAALERWRPDTEGMGRTRVVAATFQLRGRGDLHQARQYLDGLASSPPPLGGDAWTDSHLRRTEQYGRLGDRGRVREKIDEVLRSVETPSRKIRAGLMGLAFGTGSDRSYFAATVLDALRSVEPGAMRLACLRDIELVPKLEPDVGPADRQALRELGGSTDGLTTPADDALAQLRIVEVERITGDREAAVQRLRRQVERLATFEAWTALDHAIDAALRLDDPDLALDIGDTIERGAGSIQPNARASQIARLVPAAIERGRLEEADAMLAEADRVLADDPRSGSAARLHVARARLLRQRGAPVEAGHALRVALDTYRALGDTPAAAEVEAGIRETDAEVAAATPASSARPTPGAEDVPVEGGRVRIRIEIQGESVNVAIDTAGTLSPGVIYPSARRELGAAVGIVGLLENPDASPERALKEVMARLAADWRVYGGELGSLLAAAGMDHVLGSNTAPVDVLVETTHSLLPPIPWELATVIGSVPIVQDPRVATFVRSMPSRAEGVEDVRYAQATLSRVMGISTPADGILGPQTEKLLRAFQRDAGLPVHGRVDQTTLAAIRRRALDADPFPPRVVVVRAGFEQQVQQISVANERTFGVDVYRIYESQGYRVELLEQPEIGALASYTADPSTAIVHLAAGVRLTSAGIVSLDFAEGFSKSSRDPSEWTASLVSRALYRSGDGPLVVVDVPRPSSSSEVARQLVLRNKFASDLFEVLTSSAVLATGLLADSTADSHIALLERLRAGESLGASSAAARRVAAMGIDLASSVPEPAALASIALFARTPNAGIGMGRAAK
jgi:tetratricopeptide (TPR) repeat protein